jgi:hypothetical protein
LLSHPLNKEYQLQIGDQTIRSPLLLFSVAAQGYMFHKNMYKITFSTIKDLIQTCIPLLTKVKELVLDFSEVEPKSKRDPFSLFLGESS